MDNPFSADNQSNPFQTPFQQPAAQGAAPGIKPFAAIDLAPTAGHNGQHPNAPGNPTASSFMGGDFGNAFLSPSFPSSQGIPPKPPAAAPQAHAAPAAPSHLFASMAPDQDNPLFAAKPAPQAMPDYTPVPNAVPVAARKSTILTMSDFNDMVNEHKPEFFLTTTQQMDGHSIHSYLGVVSVEIVIPKDLLFRNPAPHGELHRLKAAEDELQRVKNQAFSELGDKAKKLGADGVVGVSLQFSQFDAVVFLCAAVGTAVKLAD
jgi:uncharacterized protein YbjQ (UPF0145 family)